LHRVFWNLRKRPEPPRPLSPAEKRDSALLEVRITAVVDSLVKAGIARDTVDAALRAWRQQQRGGTSGGSSTSMATTGGPLSGALGVFTERPGETTPVAPGARGGGGGGGGGDGRHGAGLRGRTVLARGGVLIMPEHKALSGSREQNLNVQYNPHLNFHGRKFVTYINLCLDPLHPPQSTIHMK
jgi:hypothetical protein